MSNKIIGVTPRINKSDTNTFIRIHRNYIDRLIQVGLNPIIITPQSDLSIILPLCSGFLVVGGDDFNPEIYHENNLLELSKDIDDEMDALDKDILDYAIKTKLPLLGICRGHQALTALMGYPLHQDIEHDNLEHPCDGKFHQVTKVTNFGLATRLPDQFVTNTFHHQATKDLPNGFEILFKNHDVIEAIEHTTLPLVGIQWHPERMDSNESKIIFEYFKELVDKNEQNN